MLEVKANDLAGVIPMPSTIADLTWHVASGITMMLIAAIGVVVWWGFTKMSDKIDILISSNTNRKVESAEVRTTVNNHIDNAGVHCKGVPCVQLRSAGEVVETGV